MKFIKLIKAEENNNSYITTKELLYGTLDDLKNNFNLGIDDLNKMKQKNIINIKNDTVYLKTGTKLKLEEKKYPFSHFQIVDYPKAKIILDYFLNKQYIKQI